MLELQHISLAFGDKEVFRNLCATINDGDFILIVGPNGAGKTTLFDIIAGRIGPDSGKIILDGNDISHVDELHRAPYISRLFQNPSLSCVPSMTVAQNLALATYKGRSVKLRNGMHTFPEQVVEEVLKPLNLGLEKLLATPMGSLSGGQRQIISFVMATLVEPRMLLLDEPSAALDPISTTKLLRFAHRYIKEHSITTLMITHDPELARVLGTTLWVVENGTIAKKYHGVEKQQLSNHDMSGDIDYAQIQRG